MTIQAFEVGSAVRVAETVKGFGKQVGFVVMVAEGAGPLLEPCPPDTPNADRDRLPREPEYGVVLTVTRPPWRKDRGHANELQYDSQAVKWFRPAELTGRAG